MRKMTPGMIGTTTPTTPIASSSVPPTSTRAFRIIRWLAMSKE